MYRAQTKLEALGKSSIQMLEKGQKEKKENEETLMPVFLGGWKAEQNTFILI